jgi:glutaconate CoA-transferase subunit A
MSKLLSMSEAVAQFVPDGASVAMCLQLEQMIPFAAAHEIIRQKKRNLTLIGPISDVLFDQVIGAGCAQRVIAAWVGNAMMGSAYNFRRAVEGGTVQVINMTNFTLALALQAGAMGVPFLPTRSAQASDTAKGSHFFYQIFSPFEPKESLWAVRALNPDVTIVHVQRTDADGNAHCWGSFGVMSAVVECPYGAHPSPVQGYYNRDDAFFPEYHDKTKTAESSDAWLKEWVYDVRDRKEYVKKIGTERLAPLAIKNHAYAAPADFGF